jgi:hypothetical protein
VYSVFPCADDGTKLLCDVAGLRGRGGKPCVIYSMGSAGKQRYFIRAVADEVSGWFVCLGGGGSLPAHVLEGGGGVSLPAHLRIFGEVGGE